MHIVETAFEDAHHIAHGRALRRSNQSDRFGSSAQWFFPARIEKSLFPAVFSNCSKASCSAPRPAGSIDSTVNLILAARFINADRAANGHLESVFRQNFIPLALLEKHAAHLCPLILKGKVIMARRSRAAIRNLPLHGDIREIFASNSRIRAVRSLTVIIRPLRLQIKRSVDSYEDQ